MDPSRIYLAVHTLEFRISLGPTLIYFSEFFHAYTVTNYANNFLFFETLSHTFPRNFQFLTEMFCIIY